MTPNTILSKTRKKIPQSPAVLSRFRGYAIVGLHNPQNKLNIGGVMRAADCYGAAMVAAGKSRQPHDGAPTDTMKMYRHLPFFEVDSLKKVIPYQCKPVAVDLLDEAHPLHSYNHPERAFYIFGPENGTLNTTVTDWCSDTIYVPTNGSMNLAESVNVVLYDRLQKQLCKRSA